MLESRLASLSGMGGYGSGRQYGRPTADASLRIDLAWMMRKGLIREAVDLAGTLHWSRGTSKAGSISYSSFMSQPDSERLVLSFTRARHGEGKDECQTVYLTHTVPNYGGKRWWMLCPISGRRVAKLYLPASGDVFASRQAWRLGYQSQRDAPHDRSFERLFRLQKRLGCEQGWEAGILRPKGMWHKTFERHWKKYWELDAQCSAEMAAMVLRLGARPNL